MLVLNEMVLVIVLDWTAIRSSTSTGVRLSTSTKSLKHCVSKPDALKSHGGLLGTVKIVR
jgi:hypothetical protein